MRGSMTPESAAQYQQEIIAICDLHADVPDDVRDNYERLRKLHSRGVFFYEAFTMVADYAWRVIEHALRVRFVTFFDGKIPFVNSVTEIRDELPAQDFANVYDAVNLGEFRNKKWKLEVRATGELMSFNGGMRHLWVWARKEGLVHGARNRNLESIYTDIRNAVAHGSYQISSPVHSARTIRDTAEIINRLWGHATLNGRLYPTGMVREILVIARKIGQSGDTQELRAHQLAEFRDPGEWTFLLVRGVYNDQNLSSFSSQFELTTFPTDYLWGPGNREDALQWLREEKPVSDTVTNLDRIFIFNVSKKEVSLPIRHDVAIATPVGSRGGDWILAKADTPFDALAHLRHKERGERCSGTNSEHECPVVVLFRGDWRRMLDELTDVIQVPTFGVD